MKGLRGAPSSDGSRIERSIQRRESLRLHLTSPDIDVVHKKCSLCAAEAVNRLVLLDSLSRRIPGTPIWTCHSHVAEVQDTLAVEAARHGYRLVVSPVVPSMPIVVGTIPPEDFKPQAGTALSAS